MTAPAPIHGRAGGGHPSRRADESHSRSERRAFDRPITRFALPADLAAAEPPEARGLPRDGVRLLAAIGDRIEHARFADLGRFLRPGDLLVVNTSATRAAAVDGSVSGSVSGEPDHGPVVVHFSTILDDNSWVVEIRTAPAADKPVRTLAAQTRIQLPDGVALTLLAPEPADQGPAGPRLWRTQPLDPGLMSRLLARHGRPIRYGYLAGDWPLDTYQTIFAQAPASGPLGATDLGADFGADLGASDLGPSDLGASAEMPSAGRPFSTELLTRLVSLGVLVAPIALHAGVSSQESGEPPTAERFRVPARTAALVNWTRRTGGRVIAVGTTVTRALESAVVQEGGPRVSDRDIRAGEFVAREFGIREFGAGESRPGDGAAPFRAAGGDARSAGSQIRTPPRDLQANELKNAGAEHQTRSTSGDPRSVETEGQARARAEAQNSSQPWTVEAGLRPVEAQVRAIDGWTSLLLGPDRPARVVDGLITGLHDPDASHLLLLEAVAGAELVQRVYDAALDRRYLWHEFGDTCLLIR